MAQVGAGQSTPREEAGLVAKSGREGKASAWLYGVCEAASQGPPSYFLPLPDLPGRWAAATPGFWKLQTALIRKVMCGTGSRLAILWT